MTILHAMEPKSQVFVTSQMTLGGAQKSMTDMSAMAKLTMKILVTDCIDFVVVTATITCKNKSFHFSYLMVGRFLSDSS